MPYQLRLEGVGGDGLQVTDQGGVSVGYPPGRCNWYPRGKEWVGGGDSNTHNVDFV